MTPFPEAEIMTIKRLEVALRKMDYKLLKDGAYKLHEKFHGGHRFEYLDLLKEMFVEISNNPAVPEDVKGILIPTIEDILSQEGITADTTTSPYEALNSNQVSNLSHLAYSASLQQEEVHQAEESSKINAFNAFGSKPHDYSSNNPPQRIFTAQSPFSAQPFKEFSNTPLNSTTAPEVALKPTQDDFEYNSNELHSIKEDGSNETLKSQEVIAETEEIKEEINPEANEQENQNVPLKNKTIAIYFGQDSSVEKNKNILKLRDIILNIDSENVNISDLFRLIAEIKTQANANVLELQGILEQLRNKGKKAKLITNSQSSQFSELFRICEDDYELKKDFLPLCGLSNLYACSNCEETHLLKEEKDINSIVLECPKCKHPMYPELYSTSLKHNFNFDYYNEALLNMAKTNVWVLIHPSLNEKLTFSLIKMAFQLNNEIEEIFILDKDINTREVYKNVFNELKPEVKVNTQISALEDFFNII